MVAVLGELPFKQFILTFTSGKYCKYCVCDFCRKVPEKKDVKKAFEYLFIYFSKEFKSSLNMKYFLTPNMIFQVSMQFPCFFIVTFSYFLHFFFMLLFFKE